MSTVIISDSTCDLSPELVSRYGIRILPLHVLLGERECRDGVDITPAEIFAWSDATKTTPKTSAPSVEDAISLMKTELDAGHDLVCLGISEQMSSSCTVMRMAAAELDAGDRVHVIDSENLSTGIGHLAVEGAEMAQQGLDAPTIAGALQRLRPRVRASFVVDTLTYLHRGGRCSGLAAMAGGMLRLHPRINVIDGGMQPGQKYRGRAAAYVQEYVRGLRGDLLDARPDRVFITHSGQDAQIVALVRQQLEDLHYFREIHETRAGGVVSSHCGPGTLGVLFIAGKEPVI